ncbi:paREP8 [Pyrobaculum aerophilum str. IM2]|uniref:PaREP8 n=3 Tax=Pyrobaculum TaxID=2276 RepID=Q8ZTK8_PYRAE|nr:MULTISPECIES: PaREP1 family protein [Pyrobaculum]AAL64753.1 paREP8 [Pyrobaculum aerophilum str. IM2]AFA38544.1 Archaeal PaREP1/PaREP8 family [Pyrobaculum oguniense TE7]HII47633.1 PaREP1/PaREP8 domain-contain protein [Pyrobaculum aerophilum]
MAISPYVLEVLRKAAGGRDLDEFLLELVADKLDPRDRVEAYLALHEKYLREAEELYARGDLPQAGEKYWGAVTALLNAIAEKRGMPHYSHRDYSLIVGRLYKETRDRDLVVGFRMAEGLHANFYNNFMEREEFDLHREAVKILIEKLRRFL